MNKRIKDAFGQVRADEALKCVTTEAVVTKMQDMNNKEGGKVQKPQRRVFATGRMVPALATFAVLVFCGGWLYYTPTTVISMDINPSIELEVNRFDRVVGITAYNDDGEELARNIDVKHEFCDEAVDEIMESETVSDLLSSDELMTISVVDSNDKRCQRVLNKVQNCTSSSTNTQCYAAGEEELRKAHDCGLSYGKYRALLELQKLDSGIEAEDIRNLTMREICDLHITMGGDGTTIHPGHKGHGNGLHQGNGQGAGSGAGNGQGHQHGHGGE